MSEAAQKPKSRKRGCWLLLVALLLVFCGFLCWPSIKEGKKYRDVIVNAESVTVVEFGHVTSNLVYTKELTRINLTPRQIADLRNVFLRASPVGGMNACIFEPHHCLICTAGDGSSKIIHLCFKCGEMALASEAKTSMHPWLDGIRSIFDEAGVPIRTEMYTFDFVNE
jgi:hypothetical protein